MILRVTALCQNETYLVCQFITHILLRYLHKGNSSFDTEIPYTEVTQTVKGLKTGQSTL